MEGEDNGARALRQRVYEVLEHGRRRDLVSRAVDWVMIGLVLGNVAAVIAQSIPDISHRLDASLQQFDRFCVLIFAIEYAARLWVAPEHPLLAKLAPARARGRFAATPLMLIDALAFVPLLMELLYAGHPLVRLTRLVRFLKIARYSPALATIGRVIAANAARCSLASSSLLACCWQRPRRCSRSKVTSSRSASATCRKRCGGPLPCSPRSAVPRSRR